MTEAPTISLAAATGARARTPLSPERLRGRYRAEARFRLYGLLALLVSGVFVVLILASILIEGMPAFRQSVLRAELELSPAIIDPTGTRTEAALRKADYMKIARTVLSKAFPEVTSRVDRKRLNRLLSSGAGDAIRAAVLADPSIIGTRVSVPLLLSDEVDLHLKGEVTTIHARGGIGGASPSATAGEITLTLQANDFGPELNAIKRGLREQAHRNEARAERLAAIADPTAQAKAAELRAEAASLLARAESAGSDETLTDQMPSLLARLNGGLVKITSIKGRLATGTVLLPLASTDEAPGGGWQVVTYGVPESNRKLADQEIAWIEALKANGMIENRFNWLFFSNGDSREPELAGIRGAIVGSMLMLSVTIALCLPLGVLAAIYLEEFAPKNWLTDLIEININNLAAVPSIVFGLLGLAVFLGYLGMPRSSPLVGGLVMALLVLPTIIIAARAALTAVPPSIRQGALAVGASPQQAVWHHVLPLALPGIMTGTIIGMARALGETAPLLMIGMVAFIVDVPRGFTEPATALPVQIYLWSDLPEPAFQSRTAAAIIVLLVFLFLMNGLAIYLRKRFETKW